MEPSCSSGSRHAYAPGRPAARVARQDARCSAQASEKRPKRKKLGSTIVRPGEDDVLLNQSAAELNPVEASSQPRVPGRA